MNHAPTAPDAGGADPTRFKLTPASAQRLGAIADVPADALAGLTVAEAAEKFRHHIEPHLFLFRKVCGRVVKTDPVTGIDHPVPFAQVQVEDTDCSLLGFFPKLSPWAWYFPFRCRREVIATARTDECGRFCVWIPRWDIDWVLRFRKERHCFPVIFDRPNLRELLDDLIPREIPGRVPGPRPGPDPDPLLLQPLDRARLIARVEESLGRPAAALLDRLQAGATLGASTAEADAHLDAPALLPFLRPPLPAELRAPAKGARPGAEGVGQAQGKGQPAAEGMAPAVRALAGRLNVRADDLQALDLRRWSGPFKRCFDVFVPQWVPLLDVPDITFRVLQDTDGDGDEETIYSEGHFQVRWDAGPLPPVTLHAWPNARAGSLCGGAPQVPCGDTPAIVLAGRLPVTGDPSVYDTANGHAVRTNRPHPSGLFDESLPLPAAASPLAGVLSLFGCHRTDAAATHYRLLYRYSADEGATFTSFTPFVNLSWPLYRLNGAGVGEWHYPTPDAAGWYPIALPGGPNDWLPQDLLLDWPSTAFPDGRYVVKLELGTGGAASSSSAEVAFNVDNSQPHAPMAVEWSFSAGGPYLPLDGTCPVVRRHAVAVDTFFRVTLSASARHLQSVQMWASGCGEGGFDFHSGSGGQQPSAGSVVYEHWHTTPADNDQVLQVVYRLPASAAQGTYSFGGIVSSRAFNPSAGGHLATPPFEYDTNPIHVYVHRAFSVFNAD